MKNFEFELPIFDYTIHCIIVEKEDVDEDFHKVEWFSKIAPDTQKEIIENTLQLTVDGYAFMDKPSHNCVIILVDNISDEDFFSVFNHEKRHIVDKILRTTVMQDEIESAAYIDGYISKCSGCKWFNCINVNGVNHGFCRSKRNMGLDSDCYEPEEKSVATTKIDYIRQEINGYINSKTKEEIEEEVNETESMFDQLHKYLENATQEELDAD